MRTRLGVIVAAIALAAVAIGCVPDQSPQPIGPNQRFSGRVNGVGSGAVITTVCAGPIWPGRTGSPVGGQTLSVVRDDAGDGDTGAYWTVFAQPDTSSYVVQMTEYGTAYAFPEGIQVPCDGTGTVTFHQCYGIVACTSGRPAVVKVTFQNIAD